MTDFLPPEPARSQRNDSESAAQSLLVIPGKVQALAMGSLQSTSCANTFATKNHCPCGRGDHLRSQLSTVPTNQLGRGTCRGSAAGLPVPVQGVPIGFGDQLGDRQSLSWRPGNQRVAR